MEVPQVAAPEAARQSDIAEKVPSETLAETKPEEAISPKYAALARREKMFRREMQKLKDEVKAREDALKAREAEYASQYVPKSKLKSDPLGTLQSEGLSYEDLTQAILNQPSVDGLALRKLEERLMSSIQETKTETQKQIEEQQKRSYEQALNQIRTETKKLADRPGFEMIKETESQEEVVKLIKETFDEQGVLMTVEEAAKEVEDYLVEEITKAAKLEKIKSRLSPPSEKTPEINAQKLTSTKTLTNQVGGTSKPLTPYERAILAFKGELK